MTDPKTTAMGALEELFKTPNGQIRFLGGIMCVAPAYSIFKYGHDASTFAYVMLGIGTGFILLSAGMAIWSASKKTTKEDN